MPSLPAYAELHCRSNFSFLTGASHPAELVATAKRRGYRALAITDECSLAGVVRAHEAAKQCELPLIIGCEMQLTLPTIATATVLASDPDADPRPAIATATAKTKTKTRTTTPLPSHRDVPTVDAAPTPHARLVLLALSRRGYGNLSHWITIARRRALKGSYRAHPGDLEGRVATAPMLVGLSGCFALLVPGLSQPFEEILAHAQWLKTWLQDRAAIAIELLHRRGDDELLDRVRRVALEVGLPLVAAGDVVMHVRSRKALQDTLTATRLNRPVSQCGLHLQPNAEQHLRSLSRIARLYRSEWTDNAVRIADQCKFSLDELQYEYPQEIVPPGETPDSHLRKLTLAKIPWRFPNGLEPKWKDQLEHELALIRQLDYARYFLTVCDVVQWARGQGILCQGRGSAANSLVCYCLGVTEVHPEKSKLLFERFISAERKEPPDIDVDFEHQRREEVIQYIYRKYGRHRAALAAVVIMYRPRSAMRDVGRALGIDLQRIDSVSKSQHWFDGRRIDPERLRENGFDPEAPLIRLWSELTHQLIGFPRHLSQHPGGFVIARESISQLVPVENAAMEEPRGGRPPPPNEEEDEGDALADEAAARSRRAALEAAPETDPFHPALRTVIQWDKDDLESLKLMKVDILALGMLSALRRSFEFIGQKVGAPVQMQDVPEEDPATYDMICKADTIGVFQIESRAQMSMLPRLRPRTYYDLVVEVAIVRPGPIQGGMVHPYLKNRLLEDHEIDYPQQLRPALERTKGVPIFQEQVMQIAMIAADFTAGEADELRRAMAAWKRKGGLGGFYERLVGRMVDKGYDSEFAERIFKQIQGFGEYGFPESHAAGFAQLAYVSSWIKRHHADAFLAALLNSQPLGFYAPAQLVRDAREHGVTVLPADVRFSQWTSTLEQSEGVPLAEPGAGEGLPHLPNGRLDLMRSGALRPVRLGLDRISGLAREAGERIVAARADGLFANSEDLARRARLDAHGLRALAAADALRGLSGHRHQAAWAVAGIDTRPTEMLRATRVHEAAAELLPPSEADDMLADYRALGLTLHRHPLALLRESLRAFRVQPAEVLRTYPHGRFARASGLVTHRQRPETAKGTIFVTLEDETGAINVIVWPRVAEAQRRPLLGARLLTVYGQWQREGEVMHLLAAKLIDHSELLQGLVARSRDFK
jgi:error-prone DNA polymerase